MSRTRPSNLQKLSCLQNRSIALLTSPARPSLLPAIDNHPPFNHKPRLFHTTPCYNAVQAPSTKRRNAQRSGSRPHGPAFPAYKLIENKPNNSARSELLNARLQDLERRAFILTSEMIHDGVVDNSMTSKKVKRIGTVLLKGAFSSVPQAAIIRVIAQAENVDVDTIFRIGTIVSRGDKEIFNWIRGSCELADSWHAIIYSMALHLRRCHDSRSVYDAETTREPRQIHAVRRIKALATRSGNTNSGQYDSDPRVLLLYAKYLGLLGQYEQGLSLIKDVLRMIEPSRSELKSYEDITVSSLVEPPWELHIWLRREAQKKIRSDRVRDTDRPLDPEQVGTLRIGAVTYQDPVALMRYARYMGSVYGVDYYEEYMGRAASGGEREACRRLANFYYLISRSRLPRLGSRVSRSVKLQDVRPSAKNPGLRSPTNFLRKLLLYFQPRPYDEYRSLAKEWYEVAFAMGCVRSGTNLALMHQQEGNTEKAEMALKEVKMQNKPDPLTQEVTQRILDTLRVGAAPGPRMRNLDL